MLTFKDKVAQPAHRQAAAVAAPLMLAALLIGVATGRVLWRRKLRRQAIQRQLRFGEHGGLLLGQHCITSTVHADAAVGGLGGAQRRADLAAVLQAGAGCGTSQGIEMLPLEALPAQLAHRLGSVSRQAASSNSQHGSRQRILGMQSMQLAPDELQVGPVS